MHEAHQNDILDDDSLRIIQGAMNVSDLHVRDIMIPRSQMVSLDHDESIKEWTAKIVASGHSRFPVLGENPDEVIGVLLANRGKYGSLEIISPETHEAILPTSLKPWFPGLNVRYGIGLQDATQHLGPGSYGHGGGCGTLLVINPQHHLVFAMVRNAQGKDFKRHQAEAELWGQTCQTEESTFH